jgi:hypothetical protein
MSLGNFKSNFLESGFPMLKDFMEIFVYLMLLLYNVCFCKCSFYVSWNCHLENDLLKTKILSTFAHGQHEVLFRLQD